MYFTFILIMGSIATILGVILVFFDHYLASYGIKKINEDINFTIAGGKHLSLYLIDNRLFISHATVGQHAGSAPLTYIGPCGWGMRHISLHVNNLPFT